MALSHAPSEVTSFMTGSAPSAGNWSPETSSSQDPFRLSYAVLFEATREGPSPRIVVTENGEYPPGMTWPHGLDVDLTGAPLEAIWYCLHLPRSLFDTIDVAPEEVQRTAHLDVPHEVILAPTYMFGDRAFVAFIRSLRPALVIHPDNRMDVAAQLSGTREPAVGLEPTPFSALGPSKLAEHWAAIARLPIDLARDRIAEPPPWTPRSEIAPLLLPSAHFTHRAFLKDGAYPGGIGPTDTRRARQFAVHQRKVLDAIVLLTSRGRSPEEISQQADAALDEVEPNVRWPVVVGLAGVAPSYRKAARQGASPSAEDSASEAAAIQVVVTHRASAANGIGLVRPEIPDESFRLLSQLEDHWTGRVRPKVVWRLLNSLGREIAKTLGDDVQRLLTKATKVTAFTNFPIGLATLPGASAPLSCIRPVSLLPIQPLTRCLQLELVPRPITYVRTGLRVLIAECLSPGDRIRALSLGGWQLVQEIVRRIPGAVCDVVEVTAREQLSERLATGDYQILVLSAHGHYDKDHNVAGIVVGDRPQMGLEFGEVPPFVILSACSTAPRGRGAVTVGDLLLAQGAEAVLGTLVPVDVRRNAILMVRFFTYIVESILGTEKHRTIDEIWHRVATSNAVNEILAASDSLQAWATTGPRETAPLTEFMLRRAIGRLRTTHIYEDTQLVLGEMAEEQGMGPLFRSTMRSQGFVPEALLYVMLGRPDRIVVADESLDGMTAKNPTTGSLGNQL